MERRLCVAEYEKDKTQQRAKRSIDMMIHAKYALFSSNDKVIARAAGPLKKQRWGSHELDDPGLNSPERAQYLDIRTLTHELIANLTMLCFSG